MNKILVIQTRVGIGDLCVFLSCIHEIAKKNQNYELHLLTKKRSCAKDFLKDDKYINKIFYLPDETGLKLNLLILKFIKKHKYNKCFIMHYGPRYFLLSLLAKVKNVFFYGFFKKNESIVRRSQTSTKEWLDDENIKFEPKIYYNKTVDQIDQITFGIGGSGSNKKWNIKKFIQLAQLINTKKKFNILLAGGPEEINDAKFISKRLADVNIVVNSICEQKIIDCVDSLLKSKIYIGNDTGFMHLSACLGINSYGLFGDTPPDYGSYSTKIIPILPEGESNITHGSMLMDKIEVDHVFRNIKF